MTKANYNRIAFVSLFFAILCFLAVIAFHFPQYLSTPQLRDVYDADQLRILLFAVMHLSLGGAIVSLIFSSEKKISFFTILIIVVAATLGGASVPVTTPIARDKLYLSLDLIILDMMLMTMIFTPLERLFFRKRQRFLRFGLSTDLAHYTINHLLMGALLYLIVIPGNWLRQYMPDFGIDSFVRSQSIWIQTFAILFLADFCQYWVHRFLHTNKRLWQFHKIHHSIQVMDWIAGSRLHILDILITRSISYIPIVCLGFSEEDFQLYLPIVAFQAIFVHTNTRFKFGPLRYLITTPLVHHWHHSSEEAALDMNFAVSFSIIDVVFGTFYCPKEWPEVYGLHQEKISENFLMQLMYPFLNQVSKSLRGQARQ